MNGKFFIFDTSSKNITSTDGKYLSPYNGRWVLSKEPTRLLSASYGDVNEWQVLYDLENGWINVPSKPMRALGLNLSITEAKIVDVNIIGPFVDYIVQYKSDGQYLYYRDRNIDGVFVTENYTVYDPDNNTKSIIGAYDIGQTYIKQFNNSVMLYPNLRLVINGNAVVAYSYAVVPERIGTILIPFGDLLEDYMPNMYLYNNNQYIISKNSLGYIRIIRLGTNIPERIERMAQYVHRINTVDTNNLLIEREERITIEPGSLDWNNKFRIKNNVNSNISQQTLTYHVNSAYNPLYNITGLRSVSMIISDTSFTLFGILTNQETEYKFTLDFINSTLINGNIQVFYGNTQPNIYRYSLVNGINRINTQFEDQSFPIGVIVPFPISTRWSIHNEVTAVGEMSQGLLAPSMISDNKTLDMYIFSNQIYFGKDSFDLFGIRYVFDGDNIYQEGIEKIAMAFGYLFMGSNNDAAFFYSSWDKSVYSFTGSRSLNKLLSLSNRSNVKTGRYDGFSGEMIFLTEDEILKSFDGRIMNFPYKPGNNIIPTKVGAYITLADGRNIMFSPKDGLNDIFEVITEFIGIDGSTVCDYERIDLRLFSPDKSTFEFTVELQTINQDTKESEQKKIIIKGADWSADGYKTVKLIPQYKKGIGLSLRVYSEQIIYITGIEFTYESTARTSNSQRTGY